MTPDVERLFEAVLQLPEGQRRAFLESQTTDSGLRREVLSLVFHDAVAEPFFDAAIRSEAVSICSSLDLTPGATIGVYRIISVLGRGGMGAVYMAERADGAFEQRVAIKVVQSYGPVAFLLERFRQERRILARLSHPNIARLFDGGSTPDGSPYFVMEYVSGESIDVFCDRSNLPLSERLVLFLKVCDAVRYAHQNLIVHRDLKPANILVNADGQPKLLDFGIAKALDTTSAGGNTTTVVLTPDYASPEQALNQEITTATDIYGLGAVLYFLLTGQSPHSLAGRSAAEIRRAICEEAPRRPSTLQPELRGDLENIVLKALHVEPARRYSSARELADDIERYLELRPVQATPNGWAYRARRFTQRHLFGVATSAAVVIGLAVSFGVALWQARVATREARTAHSVQTFLENIFRANAADQPDPAKARLTTARELLDIGARKIQGELKDAPEAKLQVLSTLGDMYYDLGVDDEAVKVNRERLNLAKRLYGNQGPVVARALVDLGVSMHSSSFVNERESILNQARNLLDQQRDFDSETRGLVLRGLAEQYESTDQAKGVEFARQSVEFYRRHPSPKGLIQALSLEAILHSDRSEFKQALPLLSEMITLSKKTEGDPNPDLPRAYAYQGEAEQEVLRLGEAEQSFRRAYTAARKLNGDEHVDTIQTGARLGNFLASWAHEKEGLSYLEAAKTTVLKIRGPGDPFHTPQVLLEYGSALVKAGRIEEGLTEIKQAVTNRRKNRPGTIYLAYMLELQASASIELGAYVDAQNLLDEASAIRGGVDDQSDRINIGTRVKLLLATARPEDAARLIERSYGPTLETGELSRTSLRALRDKAAVAVAEGDAKTAIAVADQIRPQLATSSERPYLKELEASFALYEGEAYLVLNEPAKASPLLKEAVDFRTEILDQNSPALAEALIQLAECDVQLGNREEARKLRDRARRIVAAHERLGEQYTGPLRRLEKLALRPAGQADARASSR